MLVLMCSVGSDRLAIPVQSVVEVIPRVELSSFTDCADWLAGHFIYRGRPIPVVTLVPEAKRSPNRLSNRILILAMPVNSSRELIGLMVDGATPQQLPSTELAAGQRERSLKSRWGTVQLDPEGMFHLVDLKTILRPEMLATLFPPIEESPR